MARKGCMKPGPTLMQQFILKYSLWGSNPRPMAHKTTALTTELREPCVSFPSTHNSEEAFPRSQYSVPERTKIIAHCNRNAPRGQLHSAGVSEERFAAWRNIVWVISSSREHGMFRPGGARVQHITFADGHTTSNAPDLFRPPKLSGAASGQYWGGGPPRKPSGCWQLLSFFACRRLVLPATLFALMRKTRMTGVKPGSQAWEPSMIPLHYMCQCPHAPTRKPRDEIMGG